MSVCGHDPRCPGYGPEHEAALAGKSECHPASIFQALPIPQPVVNPDKDRSLPGKRRRKARQGRL